MKIQTKSFDDIMRHIANVPKPKDDDYTLPDSKKKEIYQRGTKASQEEE